jgi:Fur family ferric uptake transcriptional regulator
MTTIGAYGIRDTKQKRAIRQVFARVERPLSTDEVLAEAQRDSKGLGIATVYRAVKTLVDEGWLAPVDVPGKGTLYEVAGKEHHHHFDCTQCGRVFELDGCVSEMSISVPRGFHAAGHELTVVGTCADCNKRRK